MKIFQDARLIKQLKSLLRSGGAAAMAARHAHAIIDHLIREGGASPKEMGRLTKYGDSRIRDCIKFDLVQAYRLVGIMRDEYIKFYFVGSHGACDHWVRNNAGIVPVFKKKDEMAVAGSEPETPEDEAGGDPGPEGDPWLYNNLTEQDLRRIFGGLCGKRGAARRSESGV